ncbi:MAG: sigma-70 family RNA polymerase sigma factor [Proteobacteria bacterium]|nr:sigma-70 family RNA polymerase sigma factor [Pseudomonadota bacterium]
MTAAARAQDDRDLVAAMAAGDSTSALSEIYNRFGGMVMAVLYRIMGSRAEAEELLQEVFLELWRRAPTYDPTRASVSTWVVTIARSRGIDALRARQRRGGGRHQPVEEAPLMQAPEHERPDERMATNQRSQRVREALAELSDVQREALELSYFGGMSHREIAEHIDIPVGTVKSRIISGMKVLRTALAAQGGLQ